MRAPITTAGVTATLVSSNVHNASSIEKQNFTDDVPATEPQHVIVYVTETGSKYHCSGCSYLAKSCIPIELETAKQSYGPCSKCCPPK
ncbi:hypothetical protein ACS3UN_04130 [Oscillospiraceae bacterium LTW-04]|nr:hypothetical protein RBH76_06335 [Oscillospiraceae bacterium MB24-C1]